MTFEATSFYINKTNESKLDDYILSISDKVSVKIIEDLEFRPAKKINFKKFSNKFLTRKEFNGLIDTLKECNAEMLNTTLYFTTGGLVYLLNRKDEHYDTKDKEKYPHHDITIDVMEFEKIFAHTDLDNEVTDFIKHFQAEKYLLETEIEIPGSAFFRVNITGLRNPDGYHPTWKFVKDVSKGLYFSKEQSIDSAVENNK